MKKIIILLLSFSLLKLYADNIEIIKESSSEIILEFRLPEFSLNENSGNTESQIDILFKENPQNLKTDLDFPYFTTDIIIPDNDKMALEILSTQTTEYKFENEVINQTAALENEVVEISNPYIFRDMRGIKLIFYPFKFDARQSNLSIYETIIVKLKSTGISQLNRKEIRCDTVPYSFNKLYEKHFLNYNEHNYFYSVNPGKIVVISTEGLKDKVSSFLNWKNHIGFTTNLYIYPEETGSSADEIHNFLTNLYENENIAYTIITGNHKIIPFSGNNEEKSDSPYGWLQGSDNYPEILIGRIPISSQAELLADYIDYENSENEFLPKNIYINSDYEGKLDNVYNRIIFQNNSSINKFDYSIKSNNFIAFTRDQLKDEFLYLDFQYNEYEFGKINNELTYQFLNILITYANNSDRNNLPKKLLQTYLKDDFLYLGEMIMQSQLANWSVTRDSLLYQFWGDPTLRLTTEEPGETYVVSNDYFNSYNSLPQIKVYSEEGLLANALAALIVDSDLKEAQYSDNFGYVDFDYKIKDIDNKNIDIVVTAKNQEPFTYNLSRKEKIVQDTLEIITSIYPNPFTPDNTKNKSIRISYQIPEDKEVSIRIYNSMGQLVKTILQEKQIKGAHQLNWLGDDNSGNIVSSGVYFCIIKAGKYISTQKILIIK